MANGTVFRIDDKELGIPIMYWKRESQGLDTLNFETTKKCAEIAFESLSDLEKAKVNFQKL